MAPRVDDVPDADIPQLALSGVHKRYNPKAAPVLSGIDLTCAQGELISLLGPSGCGKSTLLRIVAGFIPVDSGTVSIAGRDVTRLATHRRGIGIVHQDHALWPHLTVAENVGFGLEMRRVPRRERLSQVADMLDLVGLGDLGHRLPGQLSGGQRQRVALARALIVRPRVLLLDEPLSSLDANLRVHLREEIRRLQLELGVTTVFVTHDREEAMAVSDHIVLLQSGRIVQRGTAHDLYRDPVSEYVMGFTGQHAGFDVAVTGRTGSTVQLRWFDRTVDVPADRAPGVTPGGGGRVCVRPEDLRLLADDADAGPALTLTGTLLQSAFLGTSVEASVALDTGQLLAVRLHPRQMADLPERRSRVRLAVDADHVQVFPGVAATPAAEPAPEPVASLAGAAA
jgi:putative spermidine/putrescine transport system ATP-binding protein